MKQTIEVPEGFELKKVSDTEYQIVKKEVKLPNTWEEFCKTHNIIKEERAAADRIYTPFYCSDIYIRDPKYDRNFLPNEKYAEAVLALCQLIQLRDCYRQGWKPDWTDESLKHVINFIRNGKIDLSTYYCFQNIFSFQSEEIRNKFLTNFKDLLETASYLWK